MENVDRDLFEWITRNATEHLKAEAANSIRDVKRLQAKIYGMDWIKK